MSLSSQHKHRMSFRMLLSNKWHFAIISRPFTSQSIRIYPVLLPRILPLAVQYNYVGSRLWSVRRIKPLPSSKWTTGLAVAWLTMPNNTNKLLVCHGCERDEERRGRRRTLILGSVEALTGDFIANNYFNWMNFARETVPAINLICPSC